MSLESEEELVAFTDAVRLTRSRVSARIGPLHEVTNVLEWFRFLLDALLVVPAARYLPLSVALALSDAAGWIDAVIPSEAGRAARREMAACTGQRGWAGLAFAAQRLAAERKSMVYTWRIASGRERESDWTVVESGTEELHRLRAADRPFILAAGHFWAGRPSFFRAMLVPGWVSVRAATSPLRFSPFNLRLRLASPHNARKGRQIINVPDHWTRGYDWTKAPPRVSTQDEMLRELAKPGGIVNIYVDAFWEKANAYRRPFAGDVDRGFALGAARTARLSQCPVIPFLLTLGTKPRTIHMECGPSIAPPAPDDVGGDRAVIDGALDWLERAVARHPAQYPGSGFVRRWDPAAQVWRSPE